MSQAFFAGNEAWYMQKYASVAAINVCEMRVACMGARTIIMAICRLAEIAWQYVAA
jgi:hypothetical protein